MCLHEPTVYFILFHLGCGFPTLEKNLTLISLLISSFF